MLTGIFANPVNRCSIRGPTSETSVAHACLCLIHDEFFANPAIAYDDTGHAKASNLPRFDLANEMIIRYVKHLFPYDFAPHSDIEAIIKCEEKKKLSERTSGAVVVWGIPIAINPKHTYNML